MHKDDQEKAVRELRNAFVNADDWTPDVWRIMIGALWVKWQIDRLDQIADDMERSNGLRQS